MKNILPLLTLCFFAANVSAQTSLVNFNQGTWKNAQSWLYQRIPSDSDDVVLIQDIVVDTNAYCRSLTTNGFGITIKNGFKLTITGKDSVGMIDNDTLISDISLLYYENEDGSIENQGTIKRYKYDFSKRVTKAIEYYGGSDSSELTYYYSGSSKTPYKSTFSDYCDYTINDICIGRFDTTYYTYNANGIVIKDSLNSLSTLSSFDGSNKDENYKSTNKYLIYTDSVVMQSHANFLYVYGHTGQRDRVLTEYYSDDLKEYFADDTTYYRQMLKNGNIIFQRDSAKDWSGTRTCSYDSRVNPLYKVSVHYPVLPFFEKYLFRGMEQGNNPLVNDETYITPSAFGTSVHHYEPNKHAYKYKSNGYPDEVFFIYYNEDGSISDVEIVKYHYTK